MRSRGGNLSTRYLFHDHDGLPRDGLEGRPLPRFLTPREVIHSCTIFYFLVIL